MIAETLAGFEPLSRLYPFKVQKRMIHAAMLDQPEK